MRKKLLIAGAVVVGVVIVVAVAAEPIMMSLTKRHSPYEKIEYETDGCVMAVAYSRPYKKGRDIFGGLVPYGKVWRTGANDATTFEVNQDVFTGDDAVSLPAGRYALFTIPGPDEWTIIFNEVADQWGAFDYDQRRDAARSSAKVEQIENPVEQFTIEFVEQPDCADLRLTWDTVSVVLPIWTDRTDNALTQIADPTQ